METVAQKTVIKRIKPVKTVCAGNSATAASSRKRRAQARESTGRRSDATEYRATD
jgi:hypothetical protein